MKKVGISTVHTGFNYGSALQAYASTIILHELGYQGIVLSLKGSLIKGRDIRIKKMLIIALHLLRQPKNIRKRVEVYRNNIGSTYSERTKELFEIFSHEKIKPYYCTWSRLKQIAKSADFQGFLCGSDQVWNAEALYADPQYYLRFAPKDKRIAFAPSFGRDEIADYNKNIIRRYIMDIPNLSVREESGVGIIKSLTGRDAINLLDPTLLLDSAEWDQYLGLQKTNEKYLLAYFLNEPTVYAKEYIIKLTKKYQLKVIALPYQREPSEWFNAVPDAGPIEFVQYIKNAAYVCTDSFHGTAFSINFQVPFFTFDRQYGSAGKQSARIISLLDNVSLKERFNPSIKMLDTMVDFSKSEIVLSTEREKAIKYLNDALQR